LIANTERLERTSRKIQDAYRVTVETEQVHKFLELVVYLCGTYYGPKFKIFSLKSTEKLLFGVF
jgi:hypothetical protein